MTRLGPFITLLDELPSRLLAAPDVGAEDVRLVADRLDHAAARCRAVAECKAEPPYFSQVDRRTSPIRRARAC